MKSIFPLILIVAAIGLFFFEVKPIYSDVSALRAESAEYDNALAMSQELGTLRDQLSKKLESFSQADLERLGHFLPQQLDTVRIILDVDGVGVRNGIKLNDIKVAMDDSTKTADNPQVAKAATTPYQIVNVSFNFASSYSQGVKFIKDVEQSLRLFDDATVKIGPSKEKDKSLYNFDITLKTYWINR